MTEQFVDLRIGNTVDLRIYYNTEEHNLGLVLQIEGRRIQKALETRTSFMLSNYRKISNGKSMACDRNGRFSD